MINMDMLEKEMNKQNISDNDIANAIKKDLSTWYRRKAAPRTMQIGEIEDIKELLNLSGEKAAVIFLS